MAEHLFGFETEYAFRLADRSGSPLPRDLAISRIQELARSKVACVPGYQGSGGFLANGARLYLDCGVHLEFCTPECANPWDVCRYLDAAQALLTSAVDAYRAENPAVGEAAFQRCNVDYVNTAATWGTHESYLHTSDPAFMPRQLLPFLASRVIWAGAGGFDPFQQLSFTLCPRIAHFSRDISAHSTRDRGVFHTKDEPLCSRFHRLHVICGDSVCSQTVNWLKAGVTSIVVAMVDAGLRPGDGMALTSPINALRAYAAAPLERSITSTTDGRAVRAIDVQRHYQRMAAQHADAPWMSPWAGRVIVKWGQILDALEQGIDAVATTLDWAIKLRLYQQWVAQRRMEWDRLLLWGPVITRLRSAMFAIQPLPAIELSAALVLSPGAPLATAARAEDAYLAQHGLEWSSLPSVLATRAQLLEMDTRFGELGPRGIFNSLDQAGVLTHRIEGVDNIEHAMHNPPAIGRASVRGGAIRRLAGQGQRFMADWGSVLDCRTNMMLDLSDPWATTERWRRPEEVAPADEPEICTV